MDPLLLQKATQEYAVMLLQKKYGEGSRSSISMTEEKEKRRQTMAEEENAIRYASGYVVEVLEKRYEKSPITISRCLMSMEEGMAREGYSADEEEGSFLGYTHAWLDLINRGGLFRVSDDVYKFFLELELCMYPILCSETGWMQVVVTRARMQFCT